MLLYKYFTVLGYHPFYTFLASKNSIYKIFIFIIINHNFDTISNKIEINFLFVYKTRLFFTVLLR